MTSNIMCATLMKKKNIESSHDSAHFFVSHPGIIFLNKFYHVREQVNAGGKSINFMNL